MQRLEVSGAVRSLKGSLGVKRLKLLYTAQLTVVFYNWLHKQHVSVLFGQHQA